MAATLIGPTPSEYYVGFSGAIIGENFYYRTNVYEIARLNFTNQTTTIEIPTPSTFPQATFEGDLIAVGGYLYVGGNYRETDQSDQTPTLFKLDPANLSAFTQHFQIPAEPFANNFYVLGQHKGNILVSVGDTKIYSVTPAGAGTLLHTLTPAEGQAIMTSVVRGDNLYIITAMGGPSGYGALSKYNLVLDRVTHIEVADLDSRLAQASQTRMHLGSNGIVYFTSSTKTGESTTTVAVRGLDSKDRTITMTTFPDAAWPQITSDPSYMFYKGGLYLYAQGESTGLILRIEPSGAYTVVAEATDLAGAWIAPVAAYSDKVWLQGGLAVGTLDAPLFSTTDTAPAAMAVISNLLADTGSNTTSKREQLKTAIADLSQFIQSAPNPTVKAKAQEAVRQAVLALEAAENRFQGSGFSVTQQVVETADLHTEKLTELMENL